MLRKWQRQWRGYRSAGRAVQVQGFYIVNAFTRHIAHIAWVSGAASTSCQAILALHHSSPCLWICPFSFG